MAKKNKSEGAVLQQAIAELVAAVAQAYGSGQDALIPALQKVQEHFRYIPPPAFGAISRALRVPESEIYGVVTFYAQFRLTPVGKHIIRVCKGTACHVGGAENVSRALADLLGIAVDGTTADGLFTLQEVACLGCCSLAPVMMIDDEVHGHLSDAKIKKVLDAYRGENRG